MAFRRKQAFVGIDLGGSNINAIAYDARYQIAAQAKIDTEAREGYKHVVGRIQSQVDAILDDVSAAGLVCAGIGLCVPGVVDTWNDLVRVAPNLGWKDVRPLDDLNLARDGKPIPAILANDVNAGLIGELTTMDRPPRVVVAYFCGTGVGGAVSIDGQLVTGASGGAGEVGHMVVRANGRKSEAGIRGSLESYIGKWALNDKIQTQLEKGKKTALKDLISYNLKKTPVKSSSLKKAYRAGDDFCVDMMENYYAKYLGIAISQSANLLEPQLIILGGGIMEALGKELLPAIEKHLRKHCIVEPPTIQLATLADEAGPIGAAHLARYKRKA